MQPIPLTIRGRGAATDPPNRFEPITLEPDGDWIDAEAGAPAARPTRVFLDRSRSIVSRNDSPDVPFDASINPYRGCEHGCAYCYARPSHEYLGLSAGLDFESVIFAKPDAAALLRRELAAPTWRPTMLALSGVTDAYQPLERRLGIARGVVAVLAECLHPVGIITKSRLVTRDIDLLQRLAAAEAVRVDISLTTLDASLAAALEPRASSPASRLEAIAELRRAGVPAGVMAAPVIPGLTDHGLPAVLRAARDAGAMWAHLTPLRLPGAVAGLFDDWLARHRPLSRGKVLGRVRAMRGGRLNDPRFHHRFRAEGPLTEQWRALFESERRRLGLAARGPVPRADRFRPPGASLFDAV